MSVFTARIHQNVATKLNNQFNFFSIESIYVYVIVFDKYTDLL